MKLWIITYSHRHGQDVWPVWIDESLFDEGELCEPDLDEIQENLTKAGTFEPDRDDESLDSYGPFELPEELMDHYRDGVRGLFDEVPPGDGMFQKGMLRGLHRALDVLRRKP